MQINLVYLKHLLMNTYYQFFYCKQCYNNCFYNKIIVYIFDSFLMQIPEVVVLDQRLYLIILQSARSEKVCVCMCVLVTQSYPTFVTPQIVAHKAPLSMEFSRQEYWSGLPFPSPMRESISPWILPTLKIIIWHMHLFKKASYFCFIL